MDDGATTPSASSHTASSSLLNQTMNPNTPSRTIYSDRFIPCRSSSNFALFDLSLSNSQTSTSSSSAATSPDDSSNPYTTLLRAALFGPESAAIVPPLTPDNFSNYTPKSLQTTPVNSNIFRFKSETRRSLYSLSPFVFDEKLPGISPTPVKAPRKVPRSPYKVIPFLFS